jgi:hypothetical protein
MRSVLSGYEFKQTEDYTEWLHTNATGIVGLSGQRIVPTPANTLF